MKLAIKGHPTRGKEVIELLEMMGGENPNCSGICSSAYYHIDDGIIKVDCIISNHHLYTLEHFEQQYPYKVGDKVLYLNGRKEWVEGEQYAADESYILTASDVCDGRTHSNSCTSIAAPAEADRHSRNHAAR